MCAPTSDLAILISLLDTEVVLRALADVALLTNAFWPSDGEEVAPAEEGDGSGQYRDRENRGGLLDDDEDD